MDCREQARKIYEFCTAKIRERPDPLTYGEVIHHLGYKEGFSGNVIRYGLELVLIACEDKRLPDITSIIVNRSTGNPSGYENPEKPREDQAQLVFTCREWPDVDGIDWEYIWDNRKNLSDQYGTPGYWNNRR